MCSGGSKLPLPANDDEQADFVAVMDQFETFHPERSTPDKKVYAAALDLTMSEYNEDPSNYEGRFLPNQPSGDGPYIHTFGQNGDWNDVYGELEVFSVCQRPTIPAVVVNSCNKPNGEIELRAILRDVKGNYGQDANGMVAFDRFELRSSFENKDGVDYLVMTRVIGRDCIEIIVDGVTVCSEVGEKFTLRCLYSLEDRAIRKSFDVTGQDTLGSAENTGTLGYNLVVEENKNIGETIKFTITPVNAGLVYATVKSCDVTKGDKALTIVGHGADHCTNPIVNAQAITGLFTSQNKVEGSWTAFKWSTTSENNVEDQGLVCTIGLSEDASTAPVTPCELSNIRE